jgi:hypothetical protein
MSRLALALPVAAAVLAGCGGSSHNAVPATALLTAVRVGGTSITFDFKSPPLHVRAAYQPKSRIVESGSGAPVPLKGTAYVVIHFEPAATADIESDHVKPTYTGPRRLAGPGPVLETAKSSDFEADLAWAIGLDHRLPLHVTRDGATVTVNFG